MNKIFKVFLAITIAGAVSGCEDFLDRQPQSLAVDEKFWGTPSEAEAGVSGGYSLLREALCNIMAYWAYGDIPTGEFSDVAGYDFEPVRQYSLDISIPAAESWRPMRRYRDWTNFYRAIDQSNRIIEKISAMSDKGFTTVSRNHLLGEGYFLRAFTYFYMTRVWGGVPLITKAYNDPLTASFFVARASEDEVHVQIESDIEKSLELITAQQRGRAGSRANRAAVLALKAHFAAWQGDFAGTISAVNEFEGEDGYGYGPRNEQNFLDRYWKGDTEDNVFYLPRLLEDNEAGSRDGNPIDSEIGNNTGVWIGSDRFHVTEKNIPSWQLNKSRLAELFTEDDARYKFGFKFTGEEFPVVMKYLNFSVGSEPWRSRYSYVVNIFRYTDLRLLKAEALAATGDPGAVDILNEVRAVNGLEAYESDQVLEEIMEERARELFLEGHRFYDMVRMAKYHGSFRFSNMTQADFNAGKYYWPTDPILFINNTAMTQTPFWSSLL
jgi:starch-binding outer membrane protein, SusD/RagB family